MTSSDFLAERNELILAVRDIDEQLVELFNQPGTYRVTAEARELLETRAALALELKPFDIEIELPKLPMKVVP